jgi:cytochrome P450
VFGLSRIQAHTETMVEHTKRMIEDWEDGAVIDIDEEFEHLSLAILSDSLFDIDIDTQGEVMLRLRDVLDNLEVGGASTVTAMIPAWVPTPANRRWKRTLNDFDDMAKEMIEDHRNNPDSYDDLLSHMLQAEKEDGYSMSNQELRDQLKEFFVAGYDTTATTLKFTTHLFSVHSSVRQKLETELARILGGDPPTLDDLDELVYTEKVIRESLRRYPPGPAMFRQASEDTQIGGHHIPENTRVTLPQFMIQNDERFFDNPEAYQPERWSDDMDLDAPEYAYFPFGGGPRHCIGMRFGMLELTYIVSLIAQKFRFEPIYGNELDTDLQLLLGVFQPAQPIRMRVHKR